MMTPKLALFIPSLALLVSLSCTAPPVPDSPPPTEAPQELDPFPEEEDVVSHGPVRCDVFSLHIDQVGDDTISVRLETDLPQDANLMVTVSRGYTAQDEDGVDTYIAEYFSERSRVDSWLQPRTINVSDDRFLDQLHKDIRRIRGAGLRYDIRQIGDAINVRFVVPIRQPNPRFGELNAALEGDKVVVRHNMRVVEAEQTVSREFGQSSGGATSLIHTVAKEESFTAHVAGRFTPGIKLHVLSASGTDPVAVAKYLAAQQTKPLTVFYWSRRADIGKTAANHSVDCLTGPTSCKQVF